MVKTVYFIVCYYLYSLSGAAFSSCSLQVIDNTWRQMSILTQDGVGCARADLGGGGQGVGPPPFSKWFPPFFETLMPIKF